MSPPMWMPWRPLAALGEFIMHFAMVTAWIAATAGLLALSIHLCHHVIGPTRRTVLRGWITWQWHRRTTRRFADAIATGRLETAEDHARTVLGPSRVRRHAPRHHRHQPQGGTRSPTPPNRRSPAN